MSRNVGTRLDGGRKFFLGCFPTEVHGINRSTGRTEGLVCTFGSTESSTCGRITRVISSCLGGRCNRRIGSVIFLYIPTDHRRMGEDHCGRFYGRIDQLDNVRGNCSRLVLVRSHLTVRRHEEKKRGRVAGIDVVSFSETFFGNGGMLIFSSVVAANNSCTLFTRRIRGRKTRIIKNLFLTEARCGCGGM